MFAVGLFFTESSKLQAFFPSPWTLNDVRHLEKDAGKIFFFTVLLFGGKYDLGRKKDVVYFFEEKCMRNAKQCQGLI